MADLTVKVLQCFAGKGDRGPIRTANIMLGTSIEMWNVKLWQKDGKYSLDFPQIAQTQWEKDHDKKPLRAVRLHMEGDGDNRAFTAAAIELEKTIIDAILSAEIYQKKTE